MARRAHLGQIGEGSARMLDGVEEAFGGDGPVLPDAEGLFKDIALACGRMNTSPGMSPALPQALVDLPAGLLPVGARHGLGVARARRAHGTSGPKSWGV